MDENALVFKVKDNKVMCGGYEIDNQLFNNRQPAIVNVQKGGEGGVTTLAVPAGLFLLQQHVKPHTKPFIVDHQEEVISDGLYNKLLSLMETKKSKTRRNRSKNKRFTRRK